MPPPRRLHVTLPEDLMVALRRRFPGLRDATAIGRALEVLLDPGLETVRLSEGMRRELADFAAASRLPQELAVRELLSKALAAQSDEAKQHLEYLLLNVGLTRHVLLLAVDGDGAREVEIFEGARRWVQNVMSQGAVP